MLTSTPNLNSSVNDLIWGCVLNDYVTEEEEQEFTEMVGARKRPNIFQAPCTSLPCSPEEPPEIDPRDIKSRGGPQYGARRRSDGTPGIYSDVSSNDTPPLLWLSLHGDDNSQDAIQPRGRTFKESWFQQVKRSERKKEHSFRNENAETSTSRGRSIQSNRRKGSSRSLSSRGASRSIDGESSDDIDSYQASFATGDSRARSRYKASKTGGGSRSPTKRTGKNRSRSIGRRFRSSSKGRRKGGKSNEKDNSFIGSSWFGNRREESRNDTPAHRVVGRQYNNAGGGGGGSSRQEDWEPPSHSLSKRSSGRKGGLPETLPMGGTAKKNNKKSTSSASNRVRQSSGPVIRRFGDY